VNEWFYDKRIECIELGKITKDTSEDVVKSYLKSKKQVQLRLDAFNKAARDKAADVD